MPKPILALEFISDPLALFLSGVALLILFIWYFAADSERMKRNIGSVLVVGLLGICLLALIPPSRTLKGGIDIVGGSKFVLKVQQNVNPDTGQPMPLRPTDLDQAIAVIEKRLNASGTSDMQTAQVGDDSIEVQMPGMSPERASEIEETLQKVAKLELKEVNLQGSTRDTPGGPTLAERVLAEEEIIPGYRAYEYSFENQDGQLVSETLLLGRRNVVEGGDVGEAYAQQEGSTFAVGIRLTAEGGQKMTDYTSKLTAGRDRMAIVLDGEVVSAPGFRQVPLGRNFQIDGQESLEEARNLASQLMNPLENELLISQKSSVSPTLGRAVVKQGILAATWGLAFTAIFILIYYRAAGLIALTALLVNSVIIFGAMAMFGFTFTLPGIAGIILTIGMAVDANVLIYERLREEVEHGKSLPNAIRTAYEKAFSAIFDSNVTSLITAVILFWKATGTIQGFAVTLTIGLLGSMFSAILVTRVLFRWMVDLKLLKKLPMLNVFQSTKFDFISKGRIAAVISLVLLVCAIAGFAIRGEKGLGVDFTGGTQMEFQLGENRVSGLDAENAVADLETNARPVIQEQNVPGTGEMLSLRVDTADAEAVEARLREAFPEQLGQRVPVLDAAGNDTGETEWAVQANANDISPTAGKIFLQNSCVALGLGLIAILIYISVRFEFSFALGAFVAVIHDVVLATGLVVLFGGELSLLHVGAILTIAGYSINDTIIVFDRIRESLMTMRGDVKSLMNQAINATLSRTLLTSLTTIVTVSILAIFGGSGLKPFAVMILVGLIIGTYSSIFVASPIVYWWSRRKGHNLRREVLDASLAGETAAATD